MKLQVKIFHSFVKRLSAHPTSYHEKSLKENGQFGLLKTKKHPVTEIKAKFTEHYYRGYDCPTCFLLDLDQA